MKRFVVGIAVCASLMLAFFAAFATGSASALPPFPIPFPLTPALCTDAGVTAISDEYFEEEPACEDGAVTAAAIGEFGVAVCVDGVGYTYLEAGWDGETGGAAEGAYPLASDFVAGVNATPGHSAHLGTCAPAPPPRPADRYGYCSVAGNTWPNTSSLWPGGAPIPPGTFLNLTLDQVQTDMHYTGAVPAFYVQGVGITCSLTPSQAALAAASSDKAGPGGDLENPKVSTQPGWAFYTFVPSH